ncbi:MAG TPA: phosphatase PAP2 family protein [Candidatus Ozemobacteraceae bacterium]|nr:phosphatase PAP2 family protein [Candidatus Ozemobacteraceae bacterium]
MEYLLHVDRTLFHLLNGVWTSDILDVVMPVVTDAKLWAPLLIAFWLWLLFGGNGRRRALALLLIVATGATDQVSSTVVKKAVARKRPCCVEPGARLLVPCKASKSFPSSHAANTAAAAAVVWLEAGPAAGAVLALLSFVVGYSRIYIGVHYPFDVMAGWLLGMVVAWLIVLIRRRFWPGPPLTDASRPAGSEPLPS